MNIRSDSFLVRHLNQWAASFRPTSEDAESVCERILSFMASLDPADAEHYLDRGWTATFDAMEAAR
jgi:hypothetical protein